jgi:hypothetical protein
LFKQLKLALDDTRGLVRIVLQAKRILKTESAGDAPIKQPHIEFTLRKKIVLKTSASLLEVNNIIL